MKERDKRVVFIVEEGEGIARPLYRGKIPASGLQKAGWRAKAAPVLYEYCSCTCHDAVPDSKGCNTCRQDKKQHVLKAFTPGETVPDLTPRFIIAHTLLTPRPGKKPNEPLELSWQPQKEMIEQARSKDQIWLFDLDDNVWELPEWNPSYGKPYGISAHLEKWTGDFNAANGLICSTDVIAQSARDNGVTVPIYTVSNCVYTNRIESRTDHSPLRLGYIGLLDYRLKDFEVVVDELKEILKGERDNIEFWHLGASFDPDKLSIRDILRPFPVDIVERPWCSPHNFQQALRELDLAILPAYNHPFNDGRSNVVGLELMAAGVLFWSSSIAEYKKLDLSNSDRSLTEWFKFAREEELRQRWRHVAQIEVLEHGPKHYAEQLIPVLEEALKNA